MIKIKLLNKLNGEIFTKEFEYDLDTIRNFLRKCRYSKKVEVLSQIGYECEEHYRYANGY